MERATVPNKWTVVFLSVISLIAGGIIGHSIQRPESATPIAVSVPLPTSTPLPTPTLAPLRVYVSGAVHKPDVYRLPPGSIVQDAILAAGGSLADANLDAINLALELRDQQQLYAPHEGEACPPAPVSGGAKDSESASGTPININSATASELETLPGIGPARAQDIVAYREANGLFEGIEDIQHVAGIGPAIFEELKDLITVGP